MAELVKTLYKTEYTTRLGDLDGKGASADIRLSSLYNINSSKWNGEAFLNLNFSDLKDFDKESTSLSNGLIEVVKDDMKFSSWVLNDGVLEYSVGFSSIPTKMILEFDLLDSGIAAAAPSVVGSVAVSINYNVFGIMKLSAGRQQP